MSKCNCVGACLCVYVCVCAKFDFQFSFSDLPHTRCSCVFFFSLYASNCHKIIAYSRASALMALWEIGVIGGGGGGYSEIDFVRGKQTIDFGTHLRPAPPMADSWRRRSCTRDSDLSDRPPPDYCRRVQLILRHGHRCAPVQQQQQSQQ